MLALALKNWQYIGLALAGLAIASLSWLLVSSYKSNGKLQEKLSVQATYSAGLKSQLDEANNKIKSTAQAGAVSYGHCQDLVANDATRNFDLGVTFGRATCPATISPAPVP